MVREKCAAMNTALGLVIFIMGVYVAFGGAR